MTVTIDLSEEQAAAFKAQAKNLGLTVEEWLRTLAEKAATPHSIVHLQRTDPGEWFRQFRAWADSHDPNLPVLSDDAMSRESIYPDRS
jgi:hypothetical protein